ncbi:hypothetical protein C8J57DRAFT_1259674 [Mycena rebaudengoi]|nr:hypothetical protein C8J57DRAFT_1259674 [Mycena rebaudengoi]
MDATGGAARDFYHSASLSRDRDGSSCRRDSRGLGPGLHDIPDENPSQAAVPAALDRVIPSEHVARRVVSTRPRSPSSGSMHPQGRHSSNANTMSKKKWWSLPSIPSLPSANKEWTSDAGYGCMLSTGLLATAAGRVGTGGEARGDGLFSGAGFFRWREHFVAFGVLPDLLCFFFFHRPHCVPKIWTYPVPPSQSSNSPRYWQKSHKFQKHAKSGATTAPSPG